MKILISDDLAEPGIQKLMSVPEFQVEVRTKLAPEEICRIIGDYDALVIRSATKVTAEVIDAGDKLKIVARAGIGLDNVNIDAASRRGIVVMNTPEGNVVTTGEHVIAMLLALSRNIPQANSSVKAGKWEKSRFSGREVSHKVLGIIGIGRVGRIVADRA
ncbi:MAG: phosphoglycerate dehydrogenase, partial [Methanoregulaceae archaeon]|nr:phosphoglycerate dehydrogenase [Methanoregulaceae archaeon]